MGWVMLPMCENQEHNTPIQRGTLQAGRPGRASPCVALYLEIL